MRQYPPSQDDVLEVFRRWLNEQRLANYTIAERPDKVNRNSRDIDYVLNSSDRPTKIAVEVSSIWRSEDAGEEDAYFANWFERVRVRVRGGVEGTFYIFMPARVSDELKPTAFGDDLLNVIQGETASLETAVKEGKNLALEVQGVRVRLFKAKTDGSDIDYGRFMPDLSKFPDRVKDMLDEKAPKLKGYKGHGMETWIVAYNTLWPIMSPMDWDLVAAFFIFMEWLLSSGCG